MKGPEAGNEDAAGNKPASAGLRAASQARDIWVSLGHALAPTSFSPQIVAGLESAGFQTRHGVPYVVVRNPAARTYLRLDAADFELLALMDGRLTVKELVIAEYQRRGVLELGRVVALVQLLRRHRFLTEPPIDIYRALGQRLRSGDLAAVPFRLAHGLLSSRWEISGIDTALDMCYRWFGRFLFNWWTAAGASALTLVGLGLLLYMTGHRPHPLFKTTGAETLGIAAVVGFVLFALALHELAHALAVKHAGRRVERAGITVYYGFPAPFVDSTDVWMAPPRARLLTSLVGPGSGLVLAGIGGLAAAALTPGAAADLLVGVSFACIWISLLNLNPLLEMDGYYALVDLLETPLLRDRSLRFVSSGLWTRLWRRQRLKREEWGLTAFGAASLLWSLVAIALAVRFWSKLLFPSLEQAWFSGSLLARAGLLLFLLVVGVPVLAAFLTWTRWAGRRAAAELRWWTARLSARRHGQVLRALRAVPMWAAAPEPTLLELARAMGMQRVAAGDEVVRQGDPGDRMYVVVRGSYEALVEGRPVARLGQGDYFGERALLHRAPRSATVVALEAGSLAVLGKDGFERLLERDMEAREHLDRALRYRSEVAAMPLFQGLAPADLDLLLQRLEPVDAEAGEVIVRQGAPGDRFYAILSGEARVERDGVAIGTLATGECFGEVALLLDSPRTATVTALTRLRLLAMDAAGFHDLLCRYLAREEELVRLSHLRLESHRRLVELG